MKPRSPACPFPAPIYTEQEENKPAHLDIHMMGKFYCKNITNCYFRRQVWNYRWSGNFLAFAEMDFKASAFLSYHKSSRSKNSGLIVKTVSSQKVKIIGLKAQLLSASSTPLS